MSEDVRFPIGNVTSCDHRINELCSFVDNRLSSEATIWSSLLTIGLTEVEI